jgi:hypothetical protein
LPSSTGALQSLTRGFAITDSGVAIIDPDVAVIDPDVAVIDFTRGAGDLSGGVH